MRGLTKRGSAINVGQGRAGFAEGLFGPEDPVSHQRLYEWIIRGILAAPHGIGTAAKWLIPELGQRAHRLLRQWRLAQRTWRG